ncbi:MAG: 5-formyltetrahydrofolate cyclo-ligase [Roseburia sp.]|nr:5-formyltetrahydrofolate cyclo-ligase [Roseburia sp.]
MDKRRLREAVKARRDGLSGELRRKKSREIAECLLAQEWYGTADEILVYAAIRSEAELSAFFTQAYQDGKALYFPRVKGTQMEFYRVEAGEELEPGAFGVREPREQGMPWQDRAAETTPILVPGVAFSKMGERIGYGGGYYDKYLSIHRSLFPVGICFEMQISSRLPVEPLDVCMAELVTELGCRRCGTVIESI